MHAPSEYRNPTSAFIAVLNISLDVHSLQIKPIASL